MTEQERERVGEFFSILRKVDERVEGWKRRLESEPDGFPLQSYTYRP